MNKTHLRVLTAALGYLAWLTPVGADECVVTSEAAFTDYLNQMAVHLDTRVDYRYSEGMGSGMRLSDEIIPLEKPFVRGAAGIKEEDLLFVLQFDRDGAVTDIDIRRHVEHARFEVLASVFGDCLAPYEQELAAFDPYIATHVEYQIAEEQQRRAEAEEE